MHDGLDELSTTNLDELFATKVAKWVVHKKYPDQWVDSSCDENDTTTPRILCAFVGKLTFSTNANTILPYLAKTFWHAEQQANGRIHVCVHSHWASADTFARAACIALLRALK